MMRGASGDECGNLLGQEYNRPAEAGVLKKPREATLTLTFTISLKMANAGRNMQQEYHML
jgi:hypothetical protein